MNLQARVDQWQTPGNMGGGSVSRSGDRIDEPLLAKQAEQTSQWATPDTSTYSNGKMGPNIREQSAMFATPHGMSGMDLTGKLGAGGEFAAQVTLWTTPQAHDQAGGNANLVRRHGTKHGDANLADDVMMFATPKASDGHKPSAGKRATSDLSHQVRSIHDGQPLSPTRRTLRPQLNPAFTCWLMGLPCSTWTNIGHTSYGQSEMQSFLCAQRLRLRSLIGDSKHVN